MLKRLQLIDSKNQEVTMVRKDELPSLNVKEYEYWKDRIYWEYIAKKQ